MEKNIVSERAGHVGVTFEPSGRRVYVLKETKILEAAARAGMAINTPCGGQGTCGKCRVQITAGKCAPTPADRKIFTEEEIDDGWRLACQTGVCAETTVYVPESSVFAGKHQIVSRAGLAAEREVAPTVRKLYVEMAQPTLEDGRADLLRLEELVGTFTVDLPILKTISGKLRNNAFQGTAVLTDHKLIDFETGDTSDQLYGVAFDIGTTTVVGVLLNLRTGEEIAVASRMNPQVSFGDDVLSRIKHAGVSRDCLTDLHGALRRELVTMLEELCEGAGIKPHQVYEAVFAGNTTMEHLLAGVDPAQLGEVPFVPVYGRGLIVPARDLEIPIHPRAECCIFPVIGGFVGGDTVAGLLATQLPMQKGPALMVDIGTNGEIVLAHNGKVWAASTAAGPAFEGARIACGMRATEGAVEKVIVSDDIYCGVIGNVDPVGICGSGLIDLVAELLALDIITPEGRLLPPDEVPDGVPEKIRQRIVLDPDDETMLVIAGTPGTNSESKVWLTQKDVRELQLASGALRAGVNILLKTAGIDAADLKLIMIAGGFGSFIRRNHVQQIGLLPLTIDHSRIQYVGNVSLSGAKWTLLSADARREAERIARNTMHVELSTDLDFQREFADAMLFPELRNAPKV